MKKIFTLSIVLFTASLFSQSSLGNFSAYRMNPSQTATTQALTNGGVRVEVTAPTTNTLSPSRLEFFVKLVNNSPTNTITLSAKRRIVYQNPNLKLDGLGTFPDTYFCFGTNCFGSNISQPGPGDYCPLGVSGTTVAPYDNSKQNGTPFAIDLVEGLTVGKYFVMYTVFNVANTADSLSFTVEYNPTLLPSFGIHKTNNFQPLANGIVKNGSVISENTLVNSQTNDTLRIINYSTSTVTLNVKRSVTYQNPLLTLNGNTTTPTSHFCFGNACFPSNIDSATSINYTILGPYSTTITPLDNSTANSQPFITYLDEGAAIGKYFVKYKVFNVADPNDSLTFTVKYNEFSGVNEIAGLIENSSDVYPNPTNNNAFVTITLKQEGVVRTQIFNSLGALVINNTDQKFPQGKNKISVDCSALNQGIYFMCIDAGGSKITKRLVIHK